MAERDLSNEAPGLAVAVRVLAIALSLAHLVLAMRPLLSELERNALHFAGFALLFAALRPGWSRASGRLGLIVDLCLGGLTALAAAHLAFAESAIYDRGVRLAPLDWAAGVIVVLGAIEFSRRAAGWVVPALIVLALSYVLFWGSWIGGVFAFPGLSAETTMFRSVYGDDALFGTIASISSTYVFLFIIFGAFLIRSGAGEFVVDLARALAGKLVGGPGLVAVFASALTGTISGSAIANTASTGVVTIPLMKKAGFRPAFAGGVEAASSTGGQLTPPIMGAGAFVMASYTQIPYETIIAVAALPAILYFLSVAFFVRIEAKRSGLRAMENDGRTLTDALKEGGASFVLPIGLLIYLLVSGFTPTYAAVFGVGAVIVSSWLTKRPMGPIAILEALESAAKTMASSAVLLCAVGLIVNVVATAGLGATFSLMIADWSQGSLVIAIALIGLASLVLGMGLPVTAAYIVLATLSAPALAGMIADLELIALLEAGALPEQAKALFMIADPSALAKLSGPMANDEAAALVASLPLEIAAQLRELAIPAEATMAALLCAHMIIYWLSQDSNVTPPVCLAAFTAATIAKAPPMSTGFQSWKLAKGLYIVPLLFAYTPLVTGFMDGSSIAAATVFAFAIPGLYGLAAGMQGCMERAPIGWPMRIAALAAGLACLWPAGLWLNLAGAIAVAALLALDLRRSAPAPACAH